MATLDHHQLDLRYRGLRVLDPVRQSRLASSLASEGQRTPALVVPGEGGLYVLIDGFGRLAALRSLGRDTVEAVVLEVGEAEALVLGHRLETARRRSALEEGWLIEVLVEEHGRKARALALDFGRTASWVSRRLGLARALPASVQDAVRAGRIGPQVAMKYLVPLARANAQQCALLVERLGDVRPTVREVGRLYAAWRVADEATRRRIVENPALYLKVEEAVAAVPEDDAALVGEVEAISGACGRARRSLRQGAARRLPDVRRPQVARAWHEATLAFGALGQLLAAEGIDAGP